MRAPSVHCRSTVLTPAGRADVCLPVDVPVAELVPMLMDLLGTRVARGDRPVPWQLTGTTGGALPAAATLDELGVLDGELLRLGPAAPPPPPPVFDDPVDALAELAVRRAGPDRQRRAVIVLLGVVPAAALLLSGVPTSGAGGVHRWSATALAGVAAAASIAWAAHLRRRTAAPPGSSDDAPSATVVPALCAVPLAAAAGWAGFPGPTGAGALLVAAVAAGIAAALAQVAVRTADAALIAIAVVAVLKAAAAGAHVRFGAPTHAVAALTAAVALSAGPLLPRLVLRLAGLPRPLVPADATELTAGDSGADLLPPDELAARSRLAHTELAGLSGGCAVAAGVSGSFAATGGSPVWAGPVLAAAVAAVLLLRARGFADGATARVHVASGTAAVVALVGSAAPAFGPAGYLAGALILLGGAAAAVHAGCGGAASASPVARRGVDVVEAFLTAAAVPLALAAAGVFALVRGL